MPEQFNDVLIDVAGEQRGCRYLDASGFGSGCFRIGLGRLSLLRFLPWGGCNLWSRGGLLRPDPFPRLLWW